MEGKKRYIALVLFLLIGLTLFAFANPSEEQKGSGNKNNGNGKETTEVSDKTTDSDTDGTLESETNNQNQTQVLNQQPADNTYANALAAVEKAEKVLADELADVDSETLEKLLEEARNLIKDVTSNTSKADLTERADVVEEALDAIALVEALEDLVEDAENKEGIIAAIDYRTDNQVREVVENLRNKEVQEVLEDILEELNLILDDETAPSYDGIKDNETTKEDVTLTVTDDTEVTVTVTLNGEEIEYTDGKAFTEEGVYEVLLVDEAFNETTITFTIDKTAPVVTLKGKNKVLEPGYYTYDLYAYIEDASEYVALLNGETYESGTKISSRDNYTLVVTDKAGNETTIEFAIDKDKPKVSGVKDGEYYNTNVTPEITDKNLDTVTLNGEEFVSGTEVTEEGEYTLVAKDKAGNTTTVTFTIDKTPATAEVTKSNNDKSTNQDVTVTLKTNEAISTPEGWTVVTEGVEFTKVYSENGKYEVVITDKAGNTATVKFEVKRIDKVAPEATVTKSNNDKSTNQDVVVTIVANEAIYKPEGWTEVSTNKEHEFTKVYSENGKYEVVITDKAGNETVVKFEVKRIDKVAPEATVTKSNNDKSTNQDVVVTIVANEAIYKPEGWTEVSTNKEHEFTKVYSENGKYEVVITDKAGNKATIKFEVKRIDKVAPVLTVVDPNKYQLEVHSEYVDKGYSAWDEVDKDVTNLVKITYQFQAKGSSNWEVVDKLDTSKLGTYKLTYTAYDKAGNTATGTRVVEIVDTTAPVIELPSTIGLNKNEMHVEAGTIVTLEDVMAIVTDNYDADTTLAPYRADLLISNVASENTYNYDFSNGFNTRHVGRYNIYYKTKDSSGNETTACMLLIMKDTTAPLVTANLDENGNKDITLEAGVDAYKELGATVTDNVDDTYQMTEPSYINHYTLDGVFTGRVSAVDTTVLGKYLLVYMTEDAHGNVSNNQLLQSKRWVIVQDTINPTLTVKENSVGTDPYYSKISFALSDSNQIDYFEVNGVKHDRTDAKWSDANYDNIKASLVAGENTIVLYDTAGNKTEKTFYMDWTAPTVTVKNWYGSDPYRGADFKLSDNYEIDYFLVNGTKYDRTNAQYSDANYQNIKSSLVNGENTLVLYDAAGNSTTYTFTLDRVAPTITVKDSSVGINGLYSKLDLKLYDVNGVASVVINETQLPHTGYYVDINDGDAYTFQNGTNIVVVTDKAGNVTTQTFNVTKFNLVVENGVANLNSDVTLIDKPFYNEIAEENQVTINGNGKTVTQYITSADKIEWTHNNTYDSGEYVPILGDVFSSLNGAKVTVNNLKFKGTVNTIMLGNYETTTSNWFNTELNNVDVVGLEVVSFSTNISPAVAVYGNATLNNTNIYGTKLSALDTDPMWPVYDLAVVNFSNTTINGGKIGSIYTWAKSHMEINNAEVDTILSSCRKTNDFQNGGLVIGAGSKVNKIVVSNANAIITIKAGATVDTLDFNGLDQSDMTIVIEEGATVNNIVD